MKPIKQSVLNTFKRVGIDYELLSKMQGRGVAVNRFSGERCDVSPLIYHLIQWVYATSNKYEMGDMSVKISDFDRVRYFILEQDKRAYMTCID